MAELETRGPNDYLTSILSNTAEKAHQLCPHPPTPASPPTRRNSICFALKHEGLGSVRDGRVEHQCAVPSEQACQPMRSSLRTAINTSSNENDDECQKRQRHCGPPTGGSEGGVRCCVYQRCSALDQSAANGDRGCEASSQARGKVRVQSEMRFRIRRSTGATAHRTPRTSIRTLSYFFV